MMMVVLMMPRAGFTRSEVDGTSERRGLIRVSVLKTTCYYKL